MHFPVSLRLSTGKEICSSMPGAVAALAASFYFRLEKLEFLFVITAIILVFITELINTAVEAAVDLSTKEFHPLARIAKNTAARAVLFAAVFRWW